MPSIRFYLFFVLFGFLSLLYAIDFETALDTQFKVLIVMLFALSIYFFVGESFNNFKLVLFSNSLLLFLLAFYFMFSEMTIEENRLGGVFNANTYGYINFVALSSLFLLYTLMNKNKWILITLLFLIPFSFYITLQSASRGRLYFIIAIDSF